MRHGSTTQCRPKKTGTIEGRVGYQQVFFRRGVARVKSATSDYRCLRFKGSGVILVLHPENFGIISGEKFLGPAFGDGPHGWSSKGRALANPRVCSFVNPNKQPKLCRFSPWQVITRALVWESTSLPNIHRPMRSPVIFRSLFFFLVFTLLPAGAAQIQWKMKEYRGKKYVPLSQVKEFYKLTSMTQSGKQIILKNTELTLKFQAGGQEVLMNGVKFIFSNAIVALGSYHMSVTDLLKVIDPVLRPNKIAGAKAFDTVIIDPGHGGKDVGAVNSLGTEAGYNLIVGRLLKDRLQKRGFKVVMTRNTDVYLTLQQRVNLANKHKNAIFVSIHFNSAGSRGRLMARGIETFTLSPEGVAHYGRSLKDSDFIKRPGNNQDSANIALATAVHWTSLKRLNEPKLKMNIQDRGIRRARFSVLTGVKHPAILFEGGFLSHPKEKYLINTSTYQKTLANAMGDAIFFYRQATLGQNNGAKKK